jgi:polyisoprenoid-binding protein YceI
VGRTSGVTGSLEASGTTISAVEVVVDMTTIESGESRRDGQFDGRIMSVDEFPTATFTLTEPIELGSLPAEGEPISVEATGELTLRGVTQEVTVTLDAVLSNGTIAVNGSIPIDFDAYEIPDASGGPASVGRTGELELLVVFER